MEFENAADELIYVLTHGNPTPYFTDFEILESGIENEDTAFAVLQTPDGRLFTVKVIAESIYRDTYDIGHGIPGRVA